MDAVVTTVMFDGQFWIALVEKTDAEGFLSVGRYVFGAEPTNTDLLAFMRDGYALVPVYRSECRVRVKARKSRAEEARSTCKAKVAYAALRSAELGERKQAARVRREADEREKYELRVERKKEKRRGH